MSQYLVPFILSVTMKTKNQPNIDVWNLQDNIYSIFSNLNWSVETLNATVAKAQQDQ